MAIPLGGEPLLQAMLAPGGRPERNMGGPPPSNAELGTFALLLAGQAEASTVEAPAPAKAKGTQAGPGLQGQELPWEVLAAAAEEAGQLVALLQSTTLAQPLASALPGTFEAPLPETNPPAMSLPSAGTDLPVLPSAVELPADAGVSLPALPGSAAPPQPSAGEAGLPPDLAGPAPQAPGQTEMPSQVEAAVQASASQQPLEEQGQEDGARLAEEWPSTRPRTPTEQPAPAFQAVPAAITADPPSMLLPASLAEAPAAVHNTLRSSIRPSRSLEQPSAQPVAKATAGMPPATIVAEAPAAPAETMPSRLEQGTPQGPRLEEGGERTPRLALSGLGTLSPAAEPPELSRPVSLPVDATLANWPPVRQEMPAPRASAQSPAIAHSRMLAEAAPQLVLRVKEATETGVETVSVDLRPPELGRVELRLTFREGTVQVVMLAERAETFEALRQERHSLMQQMEQAGLQLGGQGLDLQHRSLSWTEREAPDLPRMQQADAGPEEEPAAAPATTRPPSSDSLIDIVA